ncbi:GNAT family N-acetyltransferase [Paenibacillus sp. RRE4]|uniref:GNAT family N-acetyltransferase n=1 Tax=Paenibacillus sp. RRE4 TaxID=2962587 RepID=UPI0028813393|nr:GNAT family N-acetyltransferase [Paenibacillus sp. RRE4]MDT0122184.1 GNAT family N-acetyltransferase [Paenibacillus sp. RRE4]
MKNPKEMTIDIRQANLNDISEVSRLFNEYRMFYGQHSDLEAATSFIKERMNKQESMIFMAACNEESKVTDTAMGLVQIYPSYSSVSMGPIWILNDLFVDSKYRQQGIARKLMQAVMKQAKRNKILRIVLSTAISNQQAQALYESEGYTQDQSFMYYECNVERETES